MPDQAPADLESPSRPGAVLSGRSSLGLTAVGGRALAVLVSLSILGIGLRLAASLAVWPVGLGIDDSAPYATAAAHNLLSDVQAPGGYPALLAALGVLTRSVAAVVVVQHLLGIVAALVFFYAVKRATGSPWPALLPAAGLLLDSDQIYLEHSVMAEGFFAIVLALAMYCAVRVLEQPGSWAWALGAGVLIGTGGLIRSAASAVVVAVVAAILLTEAPIRQRITAGALTALGTIAVLLVYALGNLGSNHKFSIGPDPGWHLYGMVAHYADCRDFRPPAGTQRLCQTTPVAQRPGLNFYLYSPDSPAQQAFGYFGSDGKVGAFARDVVEHEPSEYLQNVALNLAAYFVPSTYPAAYGNPLGGQGLSPPLDWTRNNPNAGRLAQVMAGFYAPFHVRTRNTLRRWLARWEDVFRFGATLLVICTVLTALGLLAGGSRPLLVLFGGGALSFLLAPSLIGEYSGRYTVPLVAPMLSAAAIAFQTLWRQWRGARRSTVSFRD
jgi:hypothetical protein